MLLFAAGALLCHSGYRSLGRLSHRYGMTPIELLAVLLRHAIDARTLVLVVAIASSPLYLVLAQTLTLEALSPPCPIAPDPVRRHTGAPSSMWVARRGGGSRSYSVLHTARWPGLRLGCAGYAAG